MTFKKLLTLAAAVMMAGSMWAQGSWTAPSIASLDPVDGTEYKVFNVGSGKSLAMGKAWFSWSTTAILTDAGVALTLTKDGDNWKFFRTSDQGVFTSGNGITGDAMHVDNTPNAYGITKLANGYYHIHDAGGDAESACWGYNSEFHATGVVAHADATEEGWMCEWAFVNDAVLELYAAQLKLYNLLNDAASKGVDTEAAATVYNNASANVSELNAAYNTLNIPVSYIETLASAKTLAATTDKISSVVLSALNTAIATYDDSNVDMTDNDAMQTATTALNTAIKNANSSIKSYKVIASGVVPDNSLEGWVCENSQTFHINTWSKEGNSDGSNMKTPFIENWVGRGSYLGAGKVYFKLEGLEQGEVYYVSALVRSYNEANSDAPNGPNFFINDTEVDMTVEGTTFTYNGMSGIYATLGGAATVGEDGTLTLGVKINEDRNYNWVAFKSVKIQELSAAYNAAVAKITDLNGKIPTAAYNTAYAVVTANSTVSIAAIEAIEAAAATAQEWVEPYAAFNSMKKYIDDLLAVPYTELEAGAHATLASAVSEEGLTTIEDYNNKTAAMKTAALSYAAKADPTDDNKFDLSFVLTNANLEGLPTWTGAAGWKTEQTSGNSQVMTNDNATSEDGTKKAFYEYWSNPPQTNDKFALYLEVTLPEGTYNMSCYAFSQNESGGGHVQEPDGVYFYANETQGSAINSLRLAPASIEFVNGTEQSVKIGLKTVAGNKNTWMGIGYVELYKVAPKTFVVSEDVAYDNTQEGAGAVSLTRTIKAGYNTVVLPFSMTQEEVETQFGAGTKVYVPSKLENDNLTFAVKDGISANQPCIVKATEAGTSYTIEGRTLVSGTPTYSITGLDFVGSYAASTTVEKNANNYVLSNDALYLVTTDVTLKGTRAYISLPAGSEVSSRINITFDDDATAINGVEVAKAQNGAIFNLAGQQLNGLQKGINIVNGKKVLIK